MSKVERERDWSELVAGWEDLYENATENKYAVMEQQSEALRLIEEAEEFEREALEALDGVLDVIRSREYLVRDRETPELYGLTVEDYDRAIVDADRTLAKLSDILTKLEKESDADRTLLAKMKEKVEDAEEEVREASVEGAELARVRFEVAEENLRVSEALCEDVGRLAGLVAEGGDEELDAEERAQILAELDEYWNRI